MKAAIRVRRLVPLLIALLVFAGCDRAPQLRGRISALKQLADQAEKNGAMRCAPRALAMTRAHVQFAEMELREGSLSEATEHVTRAERNAEAALLLSPTDHCTDAPRAGPPEPGDQDGDGYLDPQDSCPTEPENFNGFEDLDGCPDEPDTDGDGLLDSLDACPLLPEDGDQYLDEDGCPDLDNDLDGVPDIEDDCPLEPEDPDGYEDSDGCPDPDNDGDGVMDLEDQCPNTPGQEAEEPIGCPLQPALVVVTNCEVKITQQVHFATGKAVITRDSYPVLEAVVDVLKKNDAIKLEVQGHTDDVGSDAANLDLSERRAQAVRKFLVSRGIPPERLDATGYGEERPLVPNDSKDNRALNRRVQFMRTEGQKEGCAPTGQQAGGSATNGTPPGAAE